MTRNTTVLLLTLLLATAGAAVVPGEVNYQGLLLDPVGSPVTGNEDFDFSLHDAPSGGTSLWSETHLSVAVLDGVYDVVLGSTTPITPGLVSGGDLWLEISVGGETLTPRQRLLAVPYAIRADTAESSASVGAIPAPFVEQILEHFSFDGQDPPNLDASEGIADTDGDGLANFVDPDNDDDGLADGDEVAQGSDINLVTPILTSVAPALVDAGVTTLVSVTGANFDPGTTVSVGVENPAPQNLTAASFQVDVGPQPAASTSFVVTHPSGETASVPFTLSAGPSIGSLDPTGVEFSQTTNVTITGQGFISGMSVTFGSESPAPANLTTTSFDVSVGPQAAGLATVTVAYPSGPSDAASFDFFDPADPKVVFVTSTTTAGNLGGIAGADAICAARASAGGLGGSYLAWLGDATTDPATRFNPSLIVYENTIGQQVADDWTDLTDGILDGTIDRDESGNQVAGATVFTGVGTDGVATGDDCSGWASTSGSGRIGRPGFTSSRWTDDGTATCSGARHLYCFEQ